MSDPMQEIRASFFVECEELLEALQDGLSAMDEGDTDPETVNTVFRAVHSIKGGAGAFGLDQLVDFAHHLETALDEVRAGRLAADADLVRLFFQCADILSDLVRAAREDAPYPEARTAPAVERLAALSGGGAAREDTARADAGGVDFTPAPIALDLSELDIGEGAVPAELPQPSDYVIRFRPEPELYDSGNEPLFLLRALADLGEAEVTCRPTALPDLSAADAATACLEWTVRLRSDQEVAALREVFEFVEGLCALDIGLDQPDDAPVSPPSAAETDPPGPVPGDGAPAPEPAGGDGPARAQAARAGGTANPTVRVDLDRIDRLVNLVGELVINQAMLAQTMTGGGQAPNPQVASGLDEFQQLTRDIQDSVMMIRAQPVKSLFQRMARIVREASADVGKSVRLRTEGEATEIDKTVIERLADPLTHMVRNAVDHGLESPEKRRAAGKPAEGVVSLSAAHRSGRVIIEVADDGGGIDRERVHRIAVEKGLVPADQPLTDTEIDNLLFLPGFSTAGSVSNLSGRGVGMDVVKTAIGALGGRIAISSRPGAGTAFSISLPLTLAVLDGMVVRVCDETLVVPLSAISETLSVSPDDMRALGPRTQVLRVRDSFVPLVDLGTELGYRHPRGDYGGAIVLLIAQEDGQRAALVVDAIEDQRQVVIKGLQESYGHVPGVAAATILGDGQIALILDPSDLLARASGRSRPEAALEPAT